MAIWSIVQYREAQSESRFGAEYWRPQYRLHMAPELRWRNIGEVLYSAQYGISREMNEEDVGFPIYRMNEMEGLFLTKPQKYVEVSGPERDDFLLRPGDVLFNRTNSLKFVGRTGIFKGSERAVFASYLIRLVPRAEDVLQEYLCVYLNTPTGVSQIKRRAMESINQANVSASEIKKVPIPLFDLEFQRHVADLANNAAEDLKIANESFEQAARVLSEDIGLDRLSVGGEQVSMDSFARVWEFGRCDAEFYRPRYQRALRFLAEGGATLRDVSDLARRAFVPRSGTAFDYIEIGDVHADGSASGRAVLAEDAPSRARWIVEAGDLITSTVRPLRSLSAIIGGEQDGFVCSSGFAVLRSKNVMPEVLLVYLKNPLITEILNLYATASMYPAVSTQDLMKLPFRRPGAQASGEIVQHVRRARAAKRSSLETQANAVRLVEEAIQRGRR